MVSITSLSGVPTLSIHGPSFTLNPGFLSHFTSVPLWSEVSKTSGTSYHLPTLGHETRDFSLNTSTREFPLKPSRPSGDSSGRLGTGGDVPLVQYTPKSTVQSYIGQEWRRSEMDPVGTGPYEMTTLFHQKWSVETDPIFVRFGPSLRLFRPPRLIVLIGFQIPCL